MKSMSIHRGALDRTARHISTDRPARPEPLRETTAATRAAIERQIDEIQCTFSARWEW